MTENEKFIQSLAQDLKPTKPHLRPQIRAALWSAGFVLLNVVIMLSLRPFRPGFGDQLLEHARFAIEMGAAAVFICFLVYWVFLAMVPGQKLSKATKIIGGVSFLILVGTLFNSFFNASPSPSPVGGRPYCVEEVLVYGLLGLGFFFYFVRKAHFYHPRSLYFLMGTSAALIPGVLMQVGCMYSPLHGLLLHYLPALLIGGLATLILPLFRPKGYAVLFPPK